MTAPTPAQPNKPLRLPQELFNIVRWATPLVSIDLIVRDRTADGQVLLGLRRNEPAEGKWFVPGGRVQKEEHVDDAFRRTVTSELGTQSGVSAIRKEARLLDAYNHLYLASEHKKIDFSIHYIVLGYEVVAPALDITDLPCGPGHQHDEWKWFAVDELLNSADVHKNTKNYFREPQ